jgi:hypothetical protein
MLRIGHTMMPGKAANRDRACGSCAMRVRVRGPEVAGLLDLLILVVGELLDKIDDGTPKL